MPIKILRDKQRILNYCRQDYYLHLYSIGDLDDFFWPYTTWYALEDREIIQALILLYSGMELPTVLALTSNPPPMKTLLSELLPVLPDKFYAHLSPGLVQVFNSQFNLESHGRHLKMALTGLELIAACDTGRTIQLSTANLEEIQSLYKLAYPGNWFDPRMLESGQYFGYFEDDHLVSIAGIHVYSPTYNAAALGNITTHPDYRGSGLAAKVTAACCQSLLKNITRIGLNIKADNRAGLTLYKKLGFTEYAPYSEFMLHRKSN